MELSLRCFVQWLKQAQATIRTGSSPLPARPTHDGGIAMKRKLLGVLVAAALATSAGALTTSAMAATDHAHEHAATDALKLNAGQKWASDEPLRQSMTKIRALVDAKLPAVHRGKLDAKQYNVLGDEIEAQIGNIVQNCKLDPDADAALHVILAGMIEGNDALRGKDAQVKRSAGVVKVVHALDQYGKYFEHPGWKAPAAGH
jgi:hypothetical protein